VGVQGGSAGPEECLRPRKEGLYREGKKQTPLLKGIEGVARTYKVKYQKGRRQKFRGGGENKGSGGNKATCGGGKRSKRGGGGQWDQDLQLPFQQGKLDSWTGSIGVGQADASQGEIFAVGIKTFMLRLQSVLSGGGSKSLFGILVTGGSFETTMS